jgi:hypothetical protein
MTAHRRIATLALLALALACSSDPTANLNPNTQIKPDPLAVGSWDLDRVRPQASSVLPFACETSADRNSWPCISGAITDTIMAGIVLLDGNGTYGVAINHRVKLAGSSVVIDRVTDEQGLENAGGVRTGTWGRSASRIVLYPISTSAGTRNGELSDTSFVHGLTRMTINGAQFILR